MRLINIGNCNGVIPPKEEATLRGLASGEKVDLQRTPNLAGYGEPGSAALAAACAFGIARNRHFVGGGKRIAAVVASTFLLPNDHPVEISESDVAVTSLALAAAEPNEDELPSGFRERLAAG